jgi:RING finger protein 113A
MMQTCGLVFETTDRNKKQGNKTPETTMFRKPKRKGKNSAVRQKDDNEESETADAANSDEEPTSALLQEARKRVKAQHVGLPASTLSSSTGGYGENKSAAVLQSYQAKESSDGRDLVTSVADHHPNNKEASTSATAAGTTADGIFRDTTRNKFHAGPIRAATNIRTTVQFDYQPDVCKDYKETGFCGFGDTCIYLHDRGDTLSGWQIEQQWEEQQTKKKEQQEKEMSNFTSGSDPTTTTNDDDDANRPATAAIDDGIPFACHLCRDVFKNPVVTNCLHYFCERCIMDHVRTQSEGCPVCGKDTGSVFNQPTKLLAKKRKLLGSRRASEEDSWQEYANLFRNKTGD